MCPTRRHNLLQFSNLQGLGSLCHLKCSSSQGPMQVMALPTCYLALPYKCFRGGSNIVNLFKISVYYSFSQACLSECYFICLCIVAILTWAFPVFLLSVPASKPQPSFLQIVSEQDLALRVWHEIEYPTLSTLLNSQAPYSPNLQGKESDIVAAPFLPRSELRYLRLTWPQSCLSSIMPL